MFRAVQAWLTANFDERVPETGVIRPECGGSIIDDSDPHEESCSQHPLNWRPLPPYTGAGK